MHSLIFALFLTFFFIICFYEYICSSHSIGSFHQIINLLFFPSWKSKWKTLKLLLSLLLHPGTLCSLSLRSDFKSCPWERFPFLLLSFSLEPTPIRFCLLLPPSPDVNACSGSSLTSLLFSHFNLRQQLWRSCSLPCFLRHFRLASRSQSWNCSSCCISECFAGFSQLPVP